MMDFFRACIPHSQVLPAKGKSSYWKKGRKGGKERSKNWDYDNNLKKLMPSQHAPCQTAHTL